MSPHNPTKLISSEQLQLYAENFGFEFVENPSKAEFVIKKVTKLPYEFAKENMILPLDEIGGKLRVAFGNIKSFHLIDEVRFLVGSIPIIEVLAAEDSLSDAIERCYGQKENEATDFIQNLSKEAESHFELLSENEYDLLNRQDSSKVIRLLNMILLEAIEQGASDIHFEPTEKGIDVRYRIDGVLQMRHRPPRDMKNQLLTRIKVIAQLDIAEHRRPQDGRIKLKKGDRDIDFRVSTIPVAYGERIVLRILDKSNLSLGLAEIGLSSELLKSFRYYLKQNQGIILVTGPTGSGKTTTLYSAISDIQSQDINIMTIEDPVEYKLPQIAQMSVMPKIGVGFAEGLRSILRQDPDVILIGEIRDKETAEIAIQASLTGHLVLSTLHTNDAPSAVTRLVDMGIEPYLISSSVLAVLGQRLVRKICPHCKQKYVPEEEELIELGTKEKVGHLYKGEGCDLCFSLGYQGREAIYELMPISTKIKQQLLSNPDASHLQRIACESGMKTMRDHGLEKAKKGITTSSEVLRVTRKIE